MRRQHDVDKLNELIDWYNKFKPQAGKVIQVRFTTTQLKKFAVPIAGTNKWRYRERVLEQLTR